MGTIAAGQPDPNAPSPQQAAAAAQPKTAPDKLLGDGLNAAQAGVKAVQQVVDSLFGIADSAVPAVTGDALAVAMSVIDHAIPGGVIKEAIMGGVLAGIANPAANAIEKTLNSGELALLALAKARVDSYLQDVESKL